LKLVCSRLEGAAEKVHESAGLGKMRCGVDRKEKREREGERESIGGGGGGGEEL